MKGVSTGMLTLTTVKTEVVASKVKVVIEVVLPFMERDRFPDGFDCNPMIRIFEIT